MGTIHIRFMRHLRAHQLHTCILKKVRTSSSGLLLRTLYRTNNHNKYSCKREINGSSIVQICYQRKQRTLAQRKMRVVCCGCLQEISANDSKDIFNENLCFSLRQTTDNVKPIVSAEKRMKLREGVEVITGHKICRTNEERPIKLCNACFDKVESYVNFRARLLSSLDSLYDDASQAQPDTTRVSNYPQKVTTSNNDHSERLEDVINVDENSTPLDFKPHTSKCSNDEGSSEVSTSVSTSNARLADHGQENDHRNVSDDESSEGDDSNSTSTEILPKIQENDIESEIDVCSGEDDEVLELDGQSKRDEIVEIGSSSESDIEVCDYEPTGKRIKNYSALSPPILF